MCDNTQLATLLKYTSVSNGAFRMKMSATRMFGLIEDADESKIRVSGRGQAIVAPVTEGQKARALVDAFMAVELFKKLYDQFPGTPLPERAGLQNLFKTQFQIIEDRIPATYRILIESAEQAGLFQVAGNRSRMVLPLSLSSIAATSPAPAASPTPAPAPEVETPRHGGGSGNGGNGGSGNGIDQAFLSLLEKLPVAGQPLSAKRRKALIDAFTATVYYLHPDAEELQA